MGKLLRPRRPSRDFLDKIGIADLPPDVDVTFHDGHKEDTLFFVERVDQKGHPVLATAIDAWQSANRPTRVIYHDLRRTLIEEFGARPIVFH